MLIFLVGLLLVGTTMALVARALAMPRLRAQETVTKIGDYGFASGTAETVQEGTLVGAFDGLASILGTAFSLRRGEKGAVSARKLLMAAGMYNVDPRRLVGYQLITGGGFFALWLWLWASAGLSPLLAVLGGIGGTFIGFRAPLIIVGRRARMRLEEIEYDLPELIDLLVVAVEAGLGFGAAIKAASDRLTGPLGAEMRLMLQEQKMGLTVIEALKNVLVRVETPSLRSFVRSVVQGEQLGISIGQVLRSVADEMRKRRKAAAEERAQKAPIKMLFPLIFLIFPAMFIVLLGPAVFAFLEALG
jgi:tight adherence protein C